MYFAGNLLPLEEIFNIPRPASSPSKEIQRTWRDESQAAAARLREEEERKAEKWTAGGIIEARALDRGFRMSSSSALFHALTTQYQQKAVDRTLIGPLINVCPLSLEGKMS